MKKHFSTAVVTAKAFRKAGSEADKNGQQNVYLSVVAGRIPNTAQVMAGTIAANEGLEIGSTYAIDIFETEPSEEYGRQFQVSNLGKLSFSEILSSKKEMGQPVIVEVSENERELNPIKDVE